MSDNTQAILRARAEALARRDEAPTDERDALELLEFHLANERYAIETRFVHEVHPLRNLTPVPCTPAFVMGIVNVRGQVVTVLSLKRFFGLPEQGLTDLHRIVRIGDGDIGLLADLTVSVQHLPRTALAPPLPTQNGIGASHVLGVTADGLVVLHIERLLNDPRIVVDEEPEDAMSP